MKRDEDREMCRSWKQGEGSSQQRQEGRKENGEEVRWTRGDEDKEDWRQM